jgi:hypothetical protein
MRVSARDGWIYRIVAADQMGLPTEKEPGEKSPGPSQSHFDRRHPGRRSGCFPAEPYPPPGRADFILRASAFTPKILPREEEGNVTTLDQDLTGFVIAVGQRDRSAEQQRHHRSWADAGEF